MPTVASERSDAYAQRGAAGRRACTGGRGRVQLARMQSSVTRRAGIAGGAFTVAPGWLWRGVPGTPYLVPGTPYLIPGFRGHHI